MSTARMDYRHAAEIGIIKLLSSSLEGRALSRPHVPYVSFRVHRRRTWESRGIESSLTPGGLRLPRGSAPPNDKRPLFGHDPSASLRACPEPCEGVNSAWPSSC